ncbi:MAG: DUF2271 domain-containing protein [Bacteroidaceae bacterium]|nr:DUF2271 domain-containing protein [Bacteroidaceae bacterium]
MKTKSLFIALLASLMALPIAAKSVELSFNYQKQSGAGSNQWAVWVENSEGKVVRTLTVTSFTSKGRGGRRGYTFRPTCVPTWVKNAGAEHMTDEQIDAVTGATPKESGVQTYTWDFKDANGKEVPAGDYKIRLEATLYFNSIILYSGSFSTKDKAGEIKLTSTLTEEDEAHKNMITDVKAALK